MTPKRMGIQSAKEVKIEEERYPGREWATLELPDLYPSGEMPQIAFADNGKRLLGLSVGGVWLWQTGTRAPPKEIDSVEDSRGHFAASARW